MGNQLSFTKSEQEDIQVAIMALSQILFSKMDQGVEAPCIEGTNTVEDQDKILFFEITARRKEATNV
jgi:hypothetical protein